MSDSQSAITNTDLNQYYLKKSWMKTDCGVWVVYSIEGVLGYAELYDYDKLEIGQPAKRRVIYLGTREEAEAFVENAKVL